MGGFITLGIILVIFLWIFLSGLYVVPQQRAYIIERFGKFLKVSGAGIHVKIPLVDRIATSTSLRVNQLMVKVETKTLDNVFVTVVVSTQFRVEAANVAKAYYELQDPAGQLRSYMEDALRSAIPMLTLDDAFARKDDVASDVQATVGAEMARFGFTVVKTLITSIDPSSQVKAAMELHANVLRQTALPLKRRPQLRLSARASRVRARQITAARSPTVSLTRSRACRLSAWILTK